MNDEELMIRLATTNDIPRLLELLHQVNMVHYECRPDIFKPHTTKYNAEQLQDLLTQPDKAIFVYEDEGVQGYAFVQMEDVHDDILLQDMRTLYIDDICVDEQARGKHVGKQLFDHVRAYAEKLGCGTITLNVWEGNDAAMAFYRKLGMSVRKTCMEMMI